MQDYIYIYDRLGNLTETIKETVVSNLTDRLSGELTLSFTTKHKKLPVLERGAYIEFKNQRYSIIKVNKNSAGNEFLLEILAEQASISLVDEEITGFEFGGSVEEALSLLLTDTEFTGESDISDTIAVSSSATNVRAVLLEIAELCNGEIEYDGMVIRILKKRGGILDENIISLAKCRDVREADERNSITGETSGTSYNLTGLSPVGYSVGDEVPLIFPDLGINTITRIIGISYDPFNCVSVSIEAGEFIKDMTDEVIDFQKIYLKKAETSAEIEKYINSAEGKAGITSALSGTYITADTLNEYVKTSELNTSIGQYIEGAAGSAKIELIVSGKYATLNDIKGFVTESDVSSAITQEVSDGIGKLTLAVSNGEKSSTIKLMNDTIQLASKTIQFTGGVVFKSDLSTEGATTINGANITTGKIAASLVDTSDLIVENVWLKSSIASGTKVLTSEALSSTNLTVRLGVQEDKGWAQYLELYGTAVYLGRPGYIPSSDKNALMFDVANMGVYPKTPGKWVLGGADSYLDSVFVQNAYVKFDVVFKPGTNNESTLWVSSSGKLRFTDKNGDNHTIVDV